VLLYSTVRGLSTFALTTCARGPPAAETVPQQTRPLQADAHQAEEVCR